MMTRGGASGTRPDAVGTRPDWVVGGRFDAVVEAESAEALAGTTPVSGGAVRRADVLEPSEVAIGATRRWLAGLGNTNGSVLAREPVSEDDCLIDDGVGATSPVGGRAGFIGCVTAVDQEGMPPLL